MRQKNKPTILKNIKNMRFLIKTSWELASNNEGRILKIQEIMEILPQREWKVDPIQL